MTRTLKCGLLSSVLLVGQQLFLSSLSGAVIFQADFNGSLSGTGGEADVVSIGGTGTLFNYTTAWTEVKKANPTLGQGGYLSVKVPADAEPTNGYLGGVKMTPLSADHSWAKLVDLNPNGFVKINGGTDFFMRVPNPGAGGFITDWTRMLEVGSVTGGNLRVIVSAQYASNLRVLLTTEADGFLNGYDYADAVSNIVLDTELPGWEWSTDALYHFALTFETDVSNVVTLKVYGNTDGSRIDTDKRVDLLGSTSFKVNGRVVTKGLTSGAFTFNIGGASLNGAGAGRSVEADTLRIYDAVPSAFSGNR